MLRKFARTLFAVAAIAMATAVIFAVYSPKTNAAINSQINFQGKLTNPDGTNVADGTYSIRFRIYDHISNDAANSCSANSCKWEETQGSVSVASGLFRVALGSVNNTLSSGVDFNTSGLYLGIKVGSDLEMTPRIQFTASPYAFNAAKLNGLDSTSFVQLAQGVQTDSSIANPSIFINKTNASGTPNILQLQKSSSDVFVIGNTGNITANGTYNTNTFNSSTLQFGAGSTATIDSASGQTLQVGTGANAHNVTVGNQTGTSNLTLQGGVNGANTTLGLQVASGGVIGVGSNAVAQTVNIGNSTGASAVNIVSGSGGIAIGNSANTKTIAIGGTSADGADTVNIATNATSADSVSVGSSNSGSTTTLTAGASSVALTNAGITSQVTTDSTSAFKLKNSLGSDVVTADTTPGTSVAANPGAEVSAGFSTDWPTEGSSTITRDTTNQSSGTAAVSVNAGTTNFNGVRNRLSANPAVSTTYNVSFNYKLLSGTAIATTSSGVAVDYTPNNGTTFYACSNYSPSSIPLSTWVKVTCKIDIGAAAVTGRRLTISQQDSPASGRIFLIDNLSMVAVTSSTTSPSIKIGGDNGQGLTLFGLDTSSSAPSSGSSAVDQIGSMYFDTALNRARCYGANGWGECAGGGTNITNAFEIQNAIGSQALVVDTTPINTLVNNGNVEANDISNWATKAGTATLTQDNTNAYIGNSSFKAALTSSAINDGVKYTPSPALAATSYVVSFSIKQTAGTAFGTNLQVGWNNGASDSNCTLSPTLANQTIALNNWYRFSCTFTGSTGTTSHLYWRETDAPASARTFNIDALQIETGTVATVYKETGITLNGVIDSRLALKNKSDSTSQFIVQNASGGGLFQVDSVNSRVYIGDDVGDATGVLLVLDSKNTSGDPTGVNGGTYYNSNANKFRCYENSIWGDCSSGFNTITKTSDQQAPVSSTAMNNDNTLLFAMAANTTYIFDAWILMDNSNTTADSQYTFTTPAGATLNIATDYPTVAGATAPTACVIFVSATACAQSNSVNITNELIRVRGMVANGANAGNVQFQFTQRVSTNANFPVIKKGSTLTWHQSN